MKRHRFLLLISLVLNIVATVLSIYLARYASANGSVLSIAFTVVFLTSIILFTRLTLASITNWLLLVREGGARLDLHSSGVTKPSSANVDLLVGVRSVQFYIYFPGYLCSILIYTIYLIFLSSLLASLLIGTLLIASYPIMRYSQWRGYMIKIIREHRNVLVDTDPENRVTYRKSICDYISVRKKFWKYDVFVSYIVYLVIAGSLVLTWHTFSESNNIVTIVFVEIMFFSQLQLLIIGFSTFQEDRRSMDRVVNDIKINKEEGTTE